MSCQKIQRSHLAGTNKLATLLKGLAHIMYELHTAYILYARSGTSINDALIFLNFPTIFDRELCSHGPKSTYEKCFLILHGHRSFRICFIKILLGVVHKLRGPIFDLF